MRILQRILKYNPKSRRFISSNSQIFRKAIEKFSAQEQNIILEDALKFNRKDLAVAALSFGARINHETNFTTHPLISLFYQEDGIDTLLEIAKYHISISDLSIFSLEDPISGSSIISLSFQVSESELTDISLPYSYLLSSRGQKTILQKIINNHDINSLITFLNDNRINQDIFKGSLLDAIRNQDIVMIDILRNSEKIDPNLERFDGHTALSLACRYVPNIAKSFLSSLPSMSQKAKNLVLKESLQNNLVTISSLAISHGAKIISKDSNSKNKL